MSKRIGIIILMSFVVLALPSCDKRNGSASVTEEKALIDFAAESRDAAVKGSNLSEFHEDFGVWGYARHSDQHDYLLWEQNAMTKAVRVGQTNSYAPVEDAFWLSGYTYNFIAVAPWVGAADGISSITSGDENGEESLTFPFSLADKYSPEDDGTPDYDFDLMAAVAQTAPQASATAYCEQPLTFWHLLAKICISVSFKDAAGNPAAGTVTGMRLFNVDTDASYTISFDRDKNLIVGYDLTPNRQVTIELDRGDLDSEQTSQWTVHILPQNIADFELYMDFTLQDGNHTVVTENFEINLEAAKVVQEYYNRNEWYNWNIGITPKTITFDVSVVDWIDGGGDDFELQY